MSVTRSSWAKDIVERDPSTVDIKAEPLRPLRQDVREVSPITVAMKRLWYSLKVLAHGNSVVDKKAGHNYGRRDIP